MSSVTATYIDGVFNPDQAVDLPENTRVQLIIQPEWKQLSTEELEELWKEFDQLCAEHPIHSTEPYLTRDQLHERR